MHELATTKSIIDIVNSEAKAKGFARVLEIRLKIGEFSGVVPECLRDFFPVASKGSAAEGAELVVEKIIARFRCLDCGFEGEADRKKACCASCGSSALRITAGREFYVESIKVE